MRRDQLAGAVLVLFGVWIWDFITSLWFEYRLLTKKLRFRWEFTPYFLARYLVSAYITLNVVELLIGPDTLSRCTRAAFYTANFFIGLLGIVFSAWNLLTRTIIIWGHHPLVMKLLLAIGFLHFLLCIIVSSIGRHPCIPTRPDSNIITVFAFSTATVDLTILVFTVVGIRRASRHRKSPFARFLQAQGIAYFVVVFLIQIVMILTRFVGVDGRTIVCIGVFGATFIPILSCRLVISTLSQNYNADGNSDPRTHHIEHFELSEDPSQGPSSTRISTFIEMAKDPSEC